MKVPVGEMYGRDECYKIIPDWWKCHNGFEFPGDAYSYLASLQKKETENVS